MSCTKLFLVSTQYKDARFCIRRSFLLLVLESPGEQSAAAWQRRCWLSLSRSEIPQTKYLCHQALKANVLREAIAFILVLILEKANKYVF